MLTYQTTRRRETFGPVQLEIECLESLDQTIDQVFEYLTQIGKPELLDSLCPYFGVVWPAARELVRRLPFLPLADKSLLELGCGLAIPSLLAGQLGALVTATDTHPEVARFLTRNLALNPQSKLSYQEYDWTSRTEALGVYDYVIASDVLYDRHLPAKLARAIELNLKPGGVAIVTDPGRPYLQTFIDECEKLDLSVDSQVNEEIFSFQIRPANP